MPHWRFWQQARISGSLISRDIQTLSVTNTRTKAQFVGAKTVLLLITTYLVGAIFCTSLLVPALTLSSTDKAQRVFPSVKGKSQVAVVPTTVMSMKGSCSLRSS